MNTKPMQWGSRAFLIELLFAVMAMGLCAAICLAGFVRADTVSRNSYNLTESVVRLQTQAEFFKRDPLAYTAYADEQVIAYYDRQWNEASAPVSDGYQMTVRCVGENELYTASFSICTPDGADIFTIEAARYFPVREASA